MALLHKTQKQLLPSILFFFNTECNFGKKGTVFESGNLVDKTKHFFFTNSIIQTKPAWKSKKKRNFFVWQKTLHLTKPLLFDGKTLHLTKSFFFLSLEEFYYDFCFFTKIIVLKRKAFSHRYATSRWQTSEKEKIFGGEKKIDTFRSPTRELILDACYFVDKTRKAAGQWNNRTFSFSSRLHSIFFIVPFFFVTLNHQNCLMSAFENAWKSFERICAKRFLPFDEFFCWKLFDEKFLKTILKTYIVLRFTSTNVPCFWF